MEVVRYCKFEVVIYQDNDSLVEVLREYFKDLEIVIQSGITNTGLSAVRILSYYSSLRLLEEIEKVVGHHGVAQIEVKMLRYVG